MMVAGLWLEWRERGERWKIGRERKVREMSGERGEIEDERYVRKRRRGRERAREMARERW